jgi:hypothetical protein
MAYMVTGSVASSAHSTPRSTLDLDIVIAPTRSELLALMEEFPSNQYYADKEQAFHALAVRSQFNLVDLATGWKVDFIIAEDTEYGRTAMKRHRLIEIAGKAMYVSSAEDVIIAKLRWAKLSGSERQLRDAASIVGAQAEKLDMNYIERWVLEFDVSPQWSAVRESAS